MGSKLEEVERKTFEESLPIETSLPYDSKRDTGFVGLLKETGENKHLNSLLQILFHIPYFRHAVNHIPESVNVTSTVSSLKELFYKLQYNDTSVSRMALNTSRSSLYDEVQFLCEELEKSMTGTAEDTIRNLFEGEFIENSGYHDNYTRKESFSSIRLDVIKDVYASFDKLVEGDNKYNGTKPGVLFTKFPPVLQLHLARFESDHDTTKKLNARYEYPLELDLDRENRKYLSIDADRSIRNLYTLHSVIVHNGSGHYFALIRPKLSDLWFKFDDDLVKRVDVRRALYEQYGGDEEYPPFTFRKGSNAIMLVYVRKSDKDNILCTMEDKDITEHARQKKAEDKQSDSIVIIKVARDQDEQIDFDIVSFRIKKLSRFQKFQEIVAEHVGVPTHRLRFYKDQSLSCLVSSKKRSDTVAEIAGDSDEVRLFLQFDKSRGATGLCALCPRVEEFDIEDGPKRTGTTKPKCQP